ncbi:retrovirus-related pol polyprotein from transposon TNT 1-94 [Tanacetum coccineum]
MESNPGKENVQCYNSNARGHYAHDCPKPKVHEAKYFKEQMMMAMKDEVGGNLNDEENDFMLNNAYGDDTLEELTAAVIMMVRIQPEDYKVETEPKKDAKAISKVNASQIDFISGMLSKGVHEHINYEKLKTVINTSDDDQIHCNIIFDDPYVENNGGTDEHDSNAPDQSFDIKSLVYNVRKEAENQQRMNNELKTQKALLQKELETFGFGYQNSERLKKSIAAQPNMYDGERLQSTKLKIDSPNYEETLEDTEESRLKMKDKMIQLDYGKLNALYDTFVPQQEIPIKQTFFQLLLLLMYLLNRA